ncbi:GIY-YIG nuclease family protein [Clostridium beijerinckii]|uniref:GIY-YIG nuclease family protein n=1 Tax=Clostridium beijerinckii TaxID=1520 RepID=UPI00098BE6F4|nr:GIY-YIG nuclease family protein [Clostridium beijerinckii]MBA8935914.1 group I intron endonuclease [Clostridium beijerinckii]NRU35986.1 group I intron endonuclease [Clostridium beijerinckii]NSB00733.1 group I intron endonuclease [Clostridium beijerinckii]OOM53875.1 GIY-YIG catalytic domain protein [Clostridium beijerinckii]OOM66972.1 GIY-YIG catalytic domain protein [Clostridium beijerinckii]
MKMKVVGIYLIEDVITGNCYIGQSKDIAKRWSNHASLMKQGNYRYKELQEAYNADCKRIRYTILEECTESELQEKEDYYIKYVQKVDGWNLINKQKHGGATKSFNDTSKMKEKQTGELNGNARLTTKDVKEIKHMLADGVKQSLIAGKFGVSNTLIYNISKGKRWASVSIGGAC